MTLNHPSQVFEHLTLFTKGLMKFRISFAIVALTLGFWSCEAPVAYENSTFIYNPFSFQKDTLKNIESIEYGAGQIDWGAHFRAWVGETQYYKSGITIDFRFADTSLDISSVDSIQLQMRHQQTFPENGSDSLVNDYLRFGYFETTGQTIEIQESQYGTYLSSDTGKVTSNDNYWNYTLPSDIIVAGDSTISLGVFPESAGTLSAIYGGGSISRPVLRFFFHVPDTAGNDSATSIAYTADSLYVHLMEQPGKFDRTQYHYISQMAKDSLIIHINLDAITTGPDTTQHIISASYLPMIDSLASSIYMQDTLKNFKIRLTDPVTDYNVDIELNGNLTYKLNEIKLLVQSALDADLNELELIVRPNHMGYDPGFVGVSKNASESALFVSSSLAVLP